MTAARAFLPLAFLLATALCPNAGTAGGEECLYFAPGDPAGTPELPDGAEVWELFDENGRGGAVFTLPVSASASPRGGTRSLDFPEAGAELFLVTSPRGTDPSILTAAGEIIWAGEHLALIRASQAAADELAGAGMKIAAVLPPPGRAERRRKTMVREDGPGEEPAIRSLIDQVDWSRLSGLIGNLSGINEVAVGEETVSIPTRNSYREEEIGLATQYCRESLDNLGLAAAFHEYTWNSYNWRNVFAVQTGAVSPDEIYIICAHLDDMPDAAIAPGADDNASGAGAVMLAAEILSRRRFERTIRYVLFTGEEQGLRGSYYYVRDCLEAGDDIRGAINLDMIAYDGDELPLAEIHCGTAVAESADLGALIGDTIERYGLGLSWSAFTAGSTGASDHARFWSAGYPAVLGIEDTWVGDTYDFNPFYHTAADTRDNCDPGYAVEFTRAALGSLARLAGPLPRRAAAGDYNGDGTSDIALFRPAGGLWMVRGLTSAAFGAAGDEPAGADYDGDGTWDMTLWRPATGRWDSRGVTSFSYGINGDQPAPGDYDGDGTAEFALYRAARGRWFVRGLTRFAWGAAGDIPVPGDYGGNGTAAPALFRPGAGKWFVRGLTRVSYGAAADLPFPADYDGNGAANLTLFRPNRGTWFVRGLTRVFYGAADDLPCSADYDGNGTAEIGVFRETQGLWAIREVTRTWFGGGGDVPARP